MSRTTETQDGALSVVDKRRLWLFQWLLPFVLVIVLPIALGLTHWMRESERRQREELIATLNNLPHQYIVTIDSRDAPDPDGIVDALKTIRASQPHHSSPIDPRFVQIRSDRLVLQVCLARDSEILTEYWVSTPRNGGCGEVSFGNPHFGVLKTSRLASYWKRVDR